GGALVRTEATGLGVVFFVQEMLRSRNDSLDGMQVVISGSGNVALHAVQKVHQLGGTVVAVSDSGGYIHDENGIDLPTLREIKLEQSGRCSEYPDRREGARYIEGGRVWDVPCDVALPCATQNELTATDATTLIRNGVKAVAEGAN